MPVEIGAPGAAQPSTLMLLDGSAEVPAGACGDAVKVNFGDIGYYRVQYGPNARAALVKALAIANSAPSVAAEEAAPV